MKSYIMLENVTFYAHHGVFEQETQVGNIFILNLKIEVDLEESSRTDMLSDTVSYADVYQMVKEEMMLPSKLLEHVAGRIIRRLRREYPVLGQIELKISKRNPPVSGQVELASVVFID